MEVSYLSMLLVRPEFCQSELKDGQASSRYRIARNLHGESLLEFYSAFRGRFFDDSL